MKILLGKKLRLVIFGLLLIAIVGFLASQPNSSRYESRDILLNSKSINTTVLNNINKKDSDNDGLKDWEEGLWGTDPNNPDTDGDGTPDGEEVDNNRNPTLAGPDDNLNDDVLIRNANIDLSTENLNETDKFAQNFLEEYLSFKQGGAQIDSSTQSFLIESALQNIPIYISEQKYDKFDIIIIEDSDEALKTYGNELVKVVEKYSVTQPENELLIFEEMLRTKNEDIAKQLRQSANMYESLMQDFLNITVPEGLVSIHLEVINGYYNIAQAVQRMSTALENPIEGISGLSAYSIAIESQRNLSLPIQDYFIERKIIFDPTEDGYVWNFR